MSSAYLLYRHHCSHTILSFALNHPTTNLKASSLSSFPGARKRRNKKEREKDDKHAVHVFAKEEELDYKQPSITVKVLLPNSSSGVSLKAILYQKVEALTELKDRSNLIGLNSQRHSCTLGPSAISHWESCVTPVLAMMTTTTLQVQAQASSSFAIRIPPSSFTSPLTRSPHRFVVRAAVDPSEKSIEIMRKFSEQYARKSGTYFCVDKGVTSVVIKGLADHKDSLGAPLCPCRHYDDKPAEVGQGFWNCPCVPMRERKECHCMLFLTPDNDFAGKEQTISLDEIRATTANI